jgi:Uma2 family endonuclease
MTADPAYRLIDAEEFLDIDFGPERKAELDGGVIRMMAGGSANHARIQGNIFGNLYRRLTGSGCRPYGSDMAIKTDAFSVRFPDVSIVCNNPAQVGNDKKNAFDSAVAVFEILSASTSAYDQSVKLKEYQAMADMQTIVFVDPDRELCRIVQRTGPQAWHDDGFDTIKSVMLPSLGITLPHDEIFARD